MTFKQQLLDTQDALLGSFLNIPSPALMEMLGLAGYDYAIIDAEHGPFDLERMENCLRAAASVKLPCMVRVPKLEAELIQTVLDLGPDGIQVPQVENAEQARALVGFYNFPPQGVRGYGSTTRNAGYGFLSRRQVLEKPCQDTVIAVQIESKDGLENLPSILTTEGINVIFIGTSDLSLSLGYKTPGDPQIYSLLEKVIPQICAAGKVAGVHLSDWTWLAGLQQIGARYFTVAAAGLIRQAFQSQVEDFDARTSQLVRK